MRGFSCVEKREKESGSKKLNTNDLAMLPGRKAGAALVALLSSGERKTLHHCTLSGMMEFVGNRVLNALKPRHSQHAAEDTR